MFIYESHYDGIYTSDQFIKVEDTYCETCDDYDRLLGRADTFGKAWKLVNRKLTHTPICMVLPVLCEAFGVDKDYEVDKFGRAVLTDEEVLQKVASIVEKERRNKK